MQSLAQAGPLTFLLSRFVAQTPRPFSDVVPAELREIGTHATVLSLGSQSQWDELHRAYISGRQGNLKPWFRCLSMLRSAGARTVVAEQHYVCLDYRSEFASFYAHIDAPRRSSTTRLHFFRSDISADAIISLTPAQRRGYLGYIVCREGDLPLVGRTVLQSPNYIDESTSIVENVNFFGQKLHVRGVPFMQQDQRFAVCAHVAAWVLHYSAFRRGVQERRHIADLVGMAGTIHPLRPRTSDGLTESQVAQMLNDLGFRTAINHTPTVLTVLHTLPEVIPEELPRTVLASLKAAGIKNLSQPEPGVVDQLEEILRDHVDRVYEETSGEVDQFNIYAPPVDACHRLIDYLIRPYIRSGWPIYAGTRTHAFAICGRSWVDGSPVHFLHDDQNGPYLLARSLPALSRNSLRKQSSYPGAKDRDHAPEKDLVAKMVREAPGAYGDAQRAIESLVTAVPPRVLLAPSAANRMAQRTLAAARTAEHLSVLNEKDRMALERRSGTRVTIIMGIDYKVIRRKSALARSDNVGIQVYSSLQLAEWIVLVEALDVDGGCFAEFVYDASSSDDDPRLQFARMFTSAVSIWPLAEMSTESAVLEYDRYPVVNLPDRVGKVDP